MSLKKVTWSKDDLYNPLTLEYFINKPKEDYQIAFILGHDKPYNTDLDLTLDSKANGIKWISNKCFNQNDENYESWMKEKIAEGRVRIKKNLEAQPMKSNKKKLYELGFADGFTWKSTNGQKHLDSVGEITVVKIEANSPQEAIELTKEKYNTKKLFRLSTTDINSGVYESEFSLLTTVPIIGSDLAKKYYNMYTTELNEAKKQDKPYNRLICLQSPNGNCYRIPYPRALNIVNRFTDWKFTSKSYYKKWKKEQGKPYGPAEHPVPAPVPRKFKRATKQFERQERSKKPKKQFVKIKSTKKQIFLLESSKDLGLKAQDQSWFDANFPEYTGCKFKVIKHFKDKNNKQLSHESLWVTVEKPIIKFKTIYHQESSQVHKQYPDSKRIRKKKHFFEPITRFVMRDGKKVEFTTYKRIKRAA